MGLEGFGGFARRRCRRRCGGRRVPLAARVGLAGLAPTLDPSRIDIAIGYVGAVRRSGRMAVQCRQRPESMEEALGWRGEGVRFLRAPRTLSALRTCSTRDEGGSRSHALNLIGLCAEEHGSHQEGKDENQANNANKAHEIAGLLVFRLIAV